MLVNFLDVIEATIKSEYQTVNQIKKWSERFFYYDDQPSFWLVDLLSCKSKLDVIGTIHDAKGQYGYWCDNYWEVLAGFLYLALEEEKISFDFFIRTLVNELDSMDHIDEIAVPSIPTDFTDLLWIDLKKRVYFCKYQFQYLFDPYFYLYEQDIIFEKA